MKESRTARFLILPFP